MRRIVGSLSFLMLLCPDPLDGAWIPGRGLPYEEFGLTGLNATGAAIGSDGWIYVPGGNDQGHSARALDRVFRLHLDAGVWQEVQPLGQARFGHAVAADRRGRIFVFGGLRSNPDQVLDSVEMYDPTATNPEWLTLRPMPEPRCVHKAVTLLDGRILVIGGSDSPDFPAGKTNTVFMYDPESDTWASGVSMTEARIHHAACVGMDGLAYAIGGDGNDGSVEVFDPVRNEWNPAAALSAHPDQIGAAVADLCGFVYAIGGYGYTNAVERYDPLSNVWEAFADISSPRNNMAAAVTPGNQIVLIGGDEDYIPVLTVEIAAISCGLPCPVVLGEPVPTSIPVGYSGFAAVDFDQDEIPDIAVGDGGATVNVAKGDGTGAFTLWPVSYGDHCGTTQVVSGDFDGKNGPDIAVTNNCGSWSKVTVWLNQGLSTVGGNIVWKGFGGMRQFEVEWNPNCLAVGDLNADLRPDLVVGNHNSHSVSILLNLGDDDSGAWIGFSGTNVGVGSMPPQGVAIGDLDGDGWMDIAVATRSGESGALCLGLNGGGGSFPDSNWRTIPLSTRAVSVQLADVTGEGLADAFVPTETGHSVIAFMNPVLDVRGCERRTYSYPADVYPYRVGLRDMNGDGPKDLVVVDLAGADHLYIQRGLGAGAFEEADQALSLIPGTDPTGFSFANFNGDGLDDLVVGCMGPGRVVTLLNESPCIDSDPPVVEITMPADGAVIGTFSVRVEATVRDRSETTVQSNPPGIEAVHSPPGGGSVAGNIELLHEGTNVLAVIATDSAGNVGGDSVEVVVDSIPPTITLVSPEDGAVVGEGEVNVTVYVEDATDTVVTFGGRSTPVPGGKGSVISHRVTLTEGLNLLSITATDAANNLGIASATFELDTQAPIVTIEGISETDCFGPGDSPIALLIRVEDATATIVTTSWGDQRSLPPGGGIVPASVPLVEGPNALWVRARDEADHVGSDSICVSLDTTAPTVTITGPIDGSAVCGVVEVTATVDDGPWSCGVARIDLSIDGISLPVAEPVSPGISIVWQVDTTALGDNQAHAFMVVAIDAKGNQASDVIDLFVDNTPPGVAIVAPADGAYVAGTFDLRVDATDAGGSGVVEVKLLANQEPPTADPSRTFDPAEQSISVSGQEDTLGPIDPDGPLTIAATVTDKAGNRATVQVVVIVDNTAPSAVTVLAPSDGQVVSGTIDITAAATDQNLSAIQILVDGVSLGTSGSSPFTVRFDTASRLDGTMGIEAIACDLAGNSNRCSVTVTVDNVSFRLTPTVLSLKGKGNGTVMAHLEGVNVELLIPTEVHRIELRIPGGSPVSAEAGYSGDDSAQDTDGDGIPELNVRFDRRALVNSIRAGQMSGAIVGDSVTVSLFADGNYLIGTTVLKVNK